MAIDNDVVVRIKLLMSASRDVAHGYELRSCDRRSLVFPGLADIQQGERITLIELAFHFVSRDFVIEHRLITKICLSGVGMLLYTELLDAATAELIHVLTAVRQAIDPSRQPGVRIRLGFCLFVILAEKGVVALVIALDWRRMRAVWGFNDGVHQETGNDSAIRVAGDDFGFDDFFSDHDNSLGGADAFDHDAEISPAVRIAITIGALHVHNRDIGSERAHGPK